MTESLVRIVSDGTFFGSRVELLSGEALAGISHVSISMGPGLHPRACFEITPKMIDILAHPLLELETVRASAALYGFALVPIDPAI